MDGETSDLLASLALTEAVSFEDFELGMLLASRGVHDSATPSSEPLSVSVADNRRLLLIFGKLSAHRDIAVKRDIACVCRAPAARALSGESLRQGQQAFSELADRGLRTCLLHRSARHEARGKVAAAVNASSWIEWTTPYCNGKYRNGLVFSGLWREGTVCHVAKVVTNFMMTLAPEERESRAPVNWELDVGNPKRSAR